MIEINQSIHLESLALGMALSLAITFAVFGVRYEIRMWKQRREYRRILSSKKR